MTGYKHNKFLFSFVIGFVFFSLHAKAQNTTPQDTLQQVSIKRGVEKDSTYQNVASGEFTPGRGFDLVRTKFGSLNVSMYAMARYLNQMPGHQTWYDHLGRSREF